MSIRASSSLVRELTRFARFLAVGVLNTALGYALFALLVLTGVSPQPALLVATVLGAIFNFFSFGQIVFSGKSTLSTAGRFVAVYAVSYGINAWMLGLLVSRIGLPPLLAQIGCLPPIVALNYLLMRMFVFRSR